MQPRQALNLLDKVASCFSGNREDHVQLQTAVMVLNSLVLKHETEAEASPNEPNAAPQLEGNTKPKGEEGEK